MVRCRVVVVVARQHVPRNIEEQNSFLSHLTFFHLSVPWLLCGALPVLPNCEWQTNKKETNGRRKIQRPIKSHLERIVHVQLSTVHHTSQCIRGN